jgi:hypothetical protein
VASFGKRLIETVEAHLARRRRQQGHQNPNQRRLAGTVGAEQAKHAVADRQIDIAQGLVASLVLLAELADLDTQRPSPSGLTHSE